MFSKYVFLLLIIILQFISVQSHARERENDSINGFNDIDRDAVSLQNPSVPVWKPCISPFVELLGKGFLSINVDLRLKESYAISIGLQPSEGLLPDVMFYLFGGKLHRIEMGGGVSTGFTQDFNLAVVLIHGVIGYRYQKKKNLFLRVGFTPFYVIFLDDPERSNKFYPFAGLSLGYSL
jgi:hypothetical protein